MKYFVVFALCVAAATAFVLPPSVVGADHNVQQIIDAIYHPSTDPATAAALQQLLLDIIGINKPVVIADSPIHVGPEIIDGSIISEPENLDISPIDVSPVIIDDSIVSEPAKYHSPLVQVIINVNPNTPGNTVVVEKPTPVQIPEDVIVVEQPVFPEQVVVGPVIIPETPIIVPSPAIPLPALLN